MARSFYKPANLEPVRYHHEPSDTWYAIENRDGTFFQKRWRIGFDGRETDVLDSRIDYVMGSGNHVAAYLSRTTRGTLLELPLARYAEDGGRWALNPGHDRTYTLPPRAVAYECMFCHNSYPKIPPGHEVPRAEPVYSELPEGIDCQRCHGPGGDHVRAVREGAPLASVRRAITNPGRLSTERQMEICMQCHLETTSLQLPHSIILFGRAPFSYLPGEPLADFQYFFDHAPGTGYENDFEIAHSAYRLRKSKCFLETNKPGAGKAAMTCTTCHDPHDIPRGKTAAAHYNAVCARCHAAGGPRRAMADNRHYPGADCISCHMPRRRTEDAVNVVMTDHLIQRNRPEGDLLARLQEKESFDAGRYKGEVVPYFPAPAIYTAVAQVTHKSNLQAGIPLLAAEMARQKPVRAEFHIELGEALVAAGSPAQAVRAFEEAVRLAPTSSVALLDLAGALTESRQHQRAVDILNRAVAVSPSEPLLWYQLALAESGAGRPELAIAAVRRAVAADPGLPEAFALLGGLLAESGQLDQAEAPLRRALQLHPDHPVAVSDLAHLLAVRRNLPEAAYYFARAVKLRPDDTDSRINYSAVLDGLGQPEKAVEQAIAAVRTAPDSPDAHNLLGSLMLNRGEADSALEEFLTAVRLKPDFGRAHINAAAVLFRKGDSAAARAHLDQASRDPDPEVRRRAVEFRP